MYVYSGRGPENLGDYHGTHDRLQVCCSTLSLRGMATQSLHEASIHVPDPTMLKNRSVVSQYQV